MNDLLKVYRQASQRGTDFSESLYPSPVTIRFNNGVPSAKRSDYKDFLSLIECQQFEQLQKEYVKHLSDR